MKRILLSAAVAVAVLGGTALAKDAMMPASPMDATMLCRPATAKEKPMAMMGAKGMECKSMDKMMVAGRMGPDTKGMTAQQTDAAWRDWLDHALLVPSAYP